MTEYPNKFCIVVHIAEYPDRFHWTYWKEVDTEQELENYLDELSEMGYVIGDIFTEKEYYANL
tara:strand:+ start:2035 stop:2223 length:189 start_codon:yes stop_codon:yes gene_type:complete